MKNGFEAFKGVIPAVLSVFDEKEDLDEQGTRELVRFLMSFDIGGLYITGSTGEAFLMDSDERKRQVEIVLDEVAGRLPVIVHVGAISTRASLDLARHARRAGADGISSVPPFYFKFTEDQIFSYYRDIAEETDLPMVVYNIPLAGMMTEKMIERLASIPRVRGLKYTGTAIYEIMQIRDSCGEAFRIYGGCDEMGSSNMGLGVDGVIGSFYNCIPDLYIRIWNAVKASDIALAAELQRKALRVVTAGVSSGSMMACLKLWLRAAGVRAGWARRPFLNFTEEEREALVSTLLHIDDEEHIGLEIAKRIRAGQ